MQITVFRVYACRSCFLPVTIWQKAAGFLSSPRVLFGSKRLEALRMSPLCALPQELISINVVKGVKETVGAKSFMGRAAVPVRPFADRPGETVTDWYDLGKGEWSNEDGTVRAALPPSACV